MLPKINFEVMSIEEIAGILEWAILINDGPLPMSEYVFKLYPELKGLDWKILSVEEGTGKIKNIIYETYIKNTSKYERIINEYIEIWNQYNDLFMKNLSEVLNIDWSIQFENIKVKVGDIPVFPRDLENNCFYIGEMNKENLIKTIMHECCHFLYFEKWKQIFKNWKLEEFDSPHIIWYLSEMAIDPILNNSKIQEVYQIDFKAYQSFYSIMVDGKNLMEIIKDIYSKNEIDEAIIKTYDFVVKNENIIKQ